ncbi:MAG: heme o synthase [Gammaproteobacteria bacterium]|jgi:protoheme IX farnesyltransferase|nr:heme o synthase [Gammaproteobacteria bacterium]
MLKTIKLIYQTAKIRLGFLIMACTLAGIAVSPGNELSFWQVLVLSLAVLVSSSVSGAFNQFYERDLDAHMKRTRGRAFVTGEFSANWYWLTAIPVLLIVSVVAAALVTNVAAAIYIFLGAFTYGIVYTVWLKKRTWMNIVIGGLSGSFAVMVGAAATEATLAPAPLILAMVLFLWTPPHFWALAFACKEDYAAAGVPMLPVIVSETLSTGTILTHAILLVVLSLLPVWYGMSWIYFIGALSGGGIFVYACIRLYLEPSVPQAWRTFAASIVQLGLLLVAAMLDHVLLA